VTRRIHAARQKDARLMQQNVLRRNVPAVTRRTVVTRIMAARMRSAQNVTRRTVATRRQSINARAATALLSRIHAA
jgi:hypothetical protein